MYKISVDHIMALKDLYDSGSISRHKMKSIRGQIISMNTFDEREDYLNKIIIGSGRKVK